MSTDPSTPATVARGVTLLIASGIVTSTASDLPLSALTAMGRRMTATTPSLAA